MAELSITIRRDNGLYIVATGTLDDATVVDMSQTLVAMLFDESMKDAPTTTVTTDPTTPATPTTTP